MTLADFGMFGVWSALVVLTACVLGSAIVWRPALIRARGLSPAAPIAVALLGISALLIAPGSENVVGSRDPAVYVATAFSIARWGNTTIHDPALLLLAETVDPGQINAWLYENSYNQARVRFPTQLFIRDLDAGVVEAGFLPVVPVWMALAASIGGLEPVLHVAGAFGIIALAFAMLAAAAARDQIVEARSDDPHDRMARPTLSWPLVGAILAVSFSQVWWAREPMAESALGAMAWLVAWACVRWLADGGWRWAVLVSLGAVAALFTRADGILVAGAVLPITLVFDLRHRRVAWALLAAGFVLAMLHYVVVAPLYMSTTYGAFTFGRAIGGIAAGSIVVGLILAARWLPRLHAGAILGARMARPAVWLRRAIAVGLVLAGGVAIASGIAPGVGRISTAGAASPLAWLPGYVPWPFLLLTGAGVAVIGWRGAPRSMAPLLLLGGLPALLFLPDPLVTGDHPWMVRRLVPAVIPLIAILASIGAMALWRLSGPGGMSWSQSAGRLAVAILVGFGFAQQMVMDRALLGPRHAAGAVAGLEQLAAHVSRDGILIFPAGTAGFRLATALGYDMGVDTFAIPTGALTEEIATTLARMQSRGRSIYWAEDAARPLLVPDGVDAAPVGTVAVRYESADAGALPPPLRLTTVEERVTLYLITTR